MGSRMTHPRVELRYQKTIISIIKITNYHQQHINIISINTICPWWWRWCGRLGVGGVQAVGGSADSALAQDWFCQFFPV